MYQVILVATQQAADALKSGRQAAHPPAGFTTRVDRLLPGPGVSGAGTLPAMLVAEKR